MNGYRIVIPGDKIICYSTCDSKLGEIIVFDSLFFLNGSNYFNVAVS